MLLDKQNEFSDGQALTATALSTNVIDTLPGATNPNATQNLGGFQGSFLIVQIDVAAGGTAPTLAVSLESDSTANLATSPTVHYSSGTLEAAALTKGTLLIVPLPFGNYEKYLGLRYTLGGTSPTVTVSAFITRDVQAWQAYATGSAPNA